mmetsp:Transcript_10684/g.21035  ORF Transcript_10684/g.21035 Transcript_10684/m.21035 type:complete len:120 (-) Transcript_10684:362-721(-)
MHTSLSTRARRLQFPVVSPRNVFEGSEQAPCPAPPQPFRPRRLGEVHVYPQQRKPSRKTSISTMIVSSPFATFPEHHHLPGHLGPASTPSAPRLASGCANHLSSGTCLLACLLVFCVGP